MVCGEQKFEHKIQTELESADITIRLIKAKIDNSDNSSIVYGTILVEPQKGKINHVDLSCFELSLNESSTDNVYVDSVAHFNVERVSPQDSGKFEYSIYWTIDTKIDNSKLSSFNLVKPSDSKQCISYLD